VATSKRAPAKATTGVKKSRTAAEESTSRSQKKAPVKRKAISDDEGDETAPVPSGSRKKRSKRDEEDKRVTTRSVSDHVELEMVDVSVKKPNIIRTGG
jgi:hypothetical protein